MSQRIPLSEPCLQGNEWAYLQECITTGWISSQGEYVSNFEKRIAEYTGSDYAVACINGTSALHIALLLCGIGPGDEVIVPTVTFIAPINAVSYCGAVPVFMDCTPEHLTMDVEKTAEFLAKECHWKNGLLRNKISGKPVKAIFPVHIFGYPVEMDPLLELAEKYQLRIIEDAAESFGSQYKGKHTGTIGDVGCFSFNGNKIITAGGGGMIITNNSDFAERASYLTQQAKDDSLRCIHQQIGYNYRLTNIHAAIGLAQLEQIDQFLRIKRENANFYRRCIDEIPGISFMPEEEEHVLNNHWLYWIQVNHKENGHDPEKVVANLHQSGWKRRGNR